MPRDVNGTTQPLPGTIVSTGDTILPSQHNPMVQDVYAMITQSLSRDGQGGMRSNLDMSGFRIINIGAAQSDSDPATLGQLKMACPIGSEMDWPGDVAPTTWMLEYGQAISRTEYPELFAVLGTKYGSGDGSTTFNLPDKRGRVTAGKDNMGGTNASRLSSFFGSVATTLGGALGSATHVLTRAQLPNTQYTPEGGLSIQADINANNNNGGAGGSGIVGTGGGSIPIRFQRADFVGTPFTLGSGQAHPIAQPTLITNKIIKVSY